MTVARSKTRAAIESAIQKGYFVVAAATANHRKLAYFDRCAEAGLPSILVEQSRWTASLELTVPKAKPLTAEQRDRLLAIGVAVPGRFFDRRDLPRGEAEALAQQIAGIVSSERSST
jgi:hypothetical protein